MGQRIKGQEVQIILVQDGTVADTLTDVSNFSVELEMEIISKGYLGEKSERKDEIFKGVKWKCDLNLHTQDYIDYVQGVKDRAQRNKPDLVFNITGVLNFPNGDTPTFLVPDAKFGGIPLDISARGDYVKLTLQGESDDVTLTKS